MTAEQWGRVVYFVPKEFDSRDQPGSGFAGMQWELVSKLDALRAGWGRPLIVGSGYRTAAHNAAVGGKPNSAHLRGLAADLRTKGLGEAVQLAVLAARQGFKRIGVDLQGRFVHVDVDPALPSPVTWLYGEPAGDLG